MAAVPGWLHEYWMKRLWPALSREEVTGERVKVVLEETMQHWQERSGTTTQRPLTERSIGRYLTETRNWLREDLPLLEFCPEGCRKLEAWELALVVEHFNPPSPWWAALNDLSRETVDGRSLVLLPDPLLIVTRIGELLQYPDWALLAVGLAGATGRRIGEVLYSGSLVPKSGYSVLFTGRLKRQGAPEKAFEIPTLASAELVLAAWERLRTHQDLRDLPLQQEDKPKQVLQLINQKLSPTVRKAADHSFQDLIPTLAEDDEDKDYQKWGLYTHLLRSIYRTIAVWFYCPVHTDPDVFSATILGHTFIQEQETKAERLNLASERYYHRYAIGDGKGNVDGRRGIRLGEPGVEVIDAFAKDYALQLPTVEQAKSKRKKPVGKRTSKTGFSSLRPRVETREWFDQVAQENDLLWKDTDVTLKLLLRTYEAHKHCDGVAKPHPECVAPQDLGLSNELVGRIELALRESGQVSFSAFLTHALEREANVQIGLAKNRREREKADLSKTLLSEIGGSRRPEAALERIRRAIGTIIDYNRRCSDPNGFWYINSSLLREFTGASLDYIRPVLEANAPLIQRHHEHFGIVPAHNRTPVHKATPIAKDPALVIPDNPAEIKSLTDIATPVLSGMVQGTAAGDVQASSNLEDRN